MLQRFKDILLQRLWRSFADVGYYLQLRQESIKQSSFFFLVFYGLLSMSSAALFINRDLPHYLSLAKQAAKEAVQHFDTTSSITWNGQRLQLTGQSVFEVFYPSFIDTKKEGLPERLALIIDKNTSPTEYYNQKQQETSDPLVSTAFFLNQNSYYFQDAQRSWVQRNLNETIPPDVAFELSKIKLEQLVTQYLDPALTILDQHRFEIFIAISAWKMLAGMLIVVWNGLLASLVMRFYRIKTNFVQSFNWSIHLTILAQSINVFVQVIYPDVDFSIFTLSYWAIFTFLVISLRSKLLNENEV
ncbi:MAG: hypothetical protein ACOZAN_00350 [Patescibacteria group bacterium]